MVYGVTNRQIIDIEKEIKQTLDGVIISISKETKTPNGYGDLFIKYTSNTESKFGMDSGSFYLCSTPSNCGLVWMGGVNVRIVNKKCLKFEIVELIAKYFEHSGILLSQVNVGTRSNFWKIYEQYGFKCILQDRAVIHGGNKDLRIYYKPLNNDIKAKRGGPSWETPLGFIDKKDLKQHSDK